MTKDGFEQLIQTHGNDIYRFCYHLTGCAEDADDLYQDTLCKAFEIRRRLRDPEDGESRAPALCLRRFTGSYAFCMAAFFFGGWDMKKIIELKNITKSFDGEVVLDNISLDIYDNEFITLLGPSGCGKTTTLRIIGGFETPDSGDVIFMGEDIKDVPPYKRNVNTVFQRYALFPHLNVFENVAFSLREKKVPKDEIRRKVTEMLTLVALKGFEKRSVTSLSGGQQQRVAIARALVNQPKVLLLDEPLAALDLKLRKDMQVELKNIQKATGITFVFVTHDQEEALSMSDTVVVMSEGRIQQIGTPVDIYNEPTNAFVADFIGESNILDGVMLEDRKVSFAGHVFECVDAGFAKREPVDVVVRPEDVDIVPADRGMLKWMIQTTDFWDVDEKIGLVIEPDAIHIMKKSEYSGMFGDYSTFSDEMEEIGEVEIEELAEIEELGEILTESEKTDE